MTLNKAFVLCLAAVSLVAAGSIRHEQYEHQQQQQHYDHDTLMRQKKIFDLLWYVEQGSIVDADYYEIGRQYDIVANIDHYHHNEVVTDFIDYYRNGMLTKDDIFSYYHPEHRDQMMALYRLLYYARDFVTFYQTAAWARIHMNAGMFVTAFSTAVIYRPDTRHIRLPAIYELYPNVFFDSRVIHEAERVAMTRGHEYQQQQQQQQQQHQGVEEREQMKQQHWSGAGFETYHLFSNYSQGWPMCMSPGHYRSHDEHALGYFTHDVGLNAYYYYFRMMYPFWLSSRDTQTSLPKWIRGELYYHVHQQLMARYHLERIGRDLPDIERDYQAGVGMPGFYGQYTYHTGVAMPRRDWWNVVPYYKQRYLERLRLVEARIEEAIDSGYVVDEHGNRYGLSGPDGLNVLANLIEGNHDSLNPGYYGSYDALFRHTFGQHYEGGDEHDYVPGSLHLFATSMKDPAFYRMYGKIVDLFLRYKSRLPRYTRSELEFPGVKVESLELSEDRLTTYFDAQDYLINNAVNVPSMKDGQSFHIKAWQHRLNYKPFDYKLAVQSDKSAKAVVRFFLGPAVDDYAHLLRHFQYFYMLDEFEVDLIEGLNKIERHSGESSFFKHGHITGDKYYAKIVQALEGKEAMAQDDHQWGFPEHLYLPMGKSDAHGQRYKLYVHVSPYQPGKSLDAPFFGQRVFYGQPLGYPLDRPMQPWFMQLDNGYFRDVYVRHRVDEAVYPAYHEGRSQHGRQGGYDDYAGYDRADSMMTTMTTNAMRDQHHAYPQQRQDGGRYRANYGSSEYVKYGPSMIVPSMHRDHDAAYYQQQQQQHQTWPYGRVQGVSSEYNMKMQQQQHDRMHEMPVHY
ncbi:hypothetical protein TKK_0003819 [Trichogramma kaykai]|uniref:Uncharacterized protein n=1 Tax=Trichogramma kaykai TaxID=54128 RepID=A0ABD2XNS5_9HYME